MAISFSTSFADLGKIMAAYANANGFAGAYPNVQVYNITCTAANATVGATYTNNGVTFTVLATISSGTTLLVSGTAAPSTSGTLTKASGSGDATITFSAFTTYGQWGANGPVIKNESTMYTDILTRLEGSGLTSLVPGSAALLALQGLSDALNSLKTGCITDATNVLVLRVNNDVAQNDPSSLTLALTEWIHQMVTQSSTVQACTVSSAVTPGSNNTGTATVYASVIDPNGATLENALPETIVLRCTQDASHGATAGSETFSVTSPAIRSTTAANWPGGSGLDTTLTVVDPEQGNGQGQNLLTGDLTATDVGAFKAWSGSVPVAWTIDVDGGNIADGTSNAYAGDAHCLKFIGNTAGTNAQTSLYQNFANGSTTGGSTQTLLPGTVYMFVARVKASVVPAAGTLSFSLTDSSGNVINNNAGAANTITAVVSGFGGTTYQTITGAFQTPTVMPTGVRLRIKATTPITTATNVFVDFVALMQPVSNGPPLAGGGNVSSSGYGGLYAGGPFMAIFRGSVDPVNYVNPSIGDAYADVISNNNGSSSPTPLSFQTFFNVMFGTASLGLVLPSSGSPSISNSLIS